ncbi:MAG: hypothetical protein Q4F12_01710 [Erysipelotrichaceae bacterium]|nr:hypothetical protein [Erysipelotrichaceae bacterium]
MFKKFLTKSVSLMNFIHNAVLTINDHSGIGLTDKQLHFIFIGVFGVALLIVIFPIFNYLAKKNKIIAITWIYVFTILVCFTLAIEIGQKITGAGDMDFADIVAGILGYFVISAIAIVCKKIYDAIKK